MVPTEMRTNVLSEPGLVRLGLLVYLSDALAIEFYD